MSTELKEQLTALTADERKLLLERLRRNRSGQVEAPETGKSPGSGEATDRHWALSSAQERL